MLLFLADLRHLDDSNRASCSFKVEDTFVDIKEGSRCTGMSCRLKSTNLSAVRPACCNQHAVMPGSCLMTSIHHSSTELISVIQLIDRIDQSDSVDQSSHRPPVFLLLYRRTSVPLGMFAFFSGLHFRACHLFLLLYRSTSLPCFSPLVYRTTSVPCHS